MDVASTGDPLHLYDVALNSRLLVGTAQYPSPAILAEALAASRAEVVTVSLRREAGGGRAGESFWALIRALGLRVLPNTAGCRTVKEAVTPPIWRANCSARTWIKLEVIGEEDTLQPDVFGLVEAARNPVRRRLSGVSLHDRGSRRRGEAARRRLRGADALGRADRLGRGASTICSACAPCARIFPMSRW